MTALPSHDSMVAEIIGQWRASSAEDVAAGAAWYEQAHATAQAIAAGTDGRVTAEQAAGVIAALSPRMPWARNVTLAALVVDAWHAGADIPTGCMRARLAEAVAILERRQAGPNGHKVAAFARAILGDEEAVVVDVWAMRAAGIMDRDSLTARQYAAVAAAYTEAAERLGISPRTLQATCWVHIRGGAA